MIFQKVFGCFFPVFFGPPGARNGPKMWPKRPAFEPQSIVQIRPLAARLVAKMRFEKNARANYFGRQLFKSEGNLVMSGELVQHPDAPKTKTYPTSTGKIGFPDFSGIPEKYPENRFWPDLSRPPATFANSWKIPRQSFFLLVLGRFAAQNLPKTY